jgi:hypothetical protein
MAGKEHSNTRASRSAEKTTDDLDLIGGNLTKVAGIVRCIGALAAAEACELEEPFPAGAAHDALWAAHDMLLEASAAFGRLEVK